MVQENVAQKSCVQGNVVYELLYRKGRTYSIVQERLYRRMLYMKYCTKKCCTEYFVHGNVVPEHVL